MPIWLPPPAATPWLADTDTRSADVGHGGRPGGAVAAEREGAVCDGAPVLFDGVAVAVPAREAPVAACGTVVLPQAATRAVAPARTAAAVSVRAVLANGVMGVPPRLL